MNRSPWTSTALAATLVASALLSACAGTSKTPPAAPVAAASPSVLDVAEKQAQLGTFTRLVRQAGLEGTLSQPGDLTVFAPTDEAFKALPAKTFESLVADKAALRSVLSYHVLPMRVQAAQVRPGAAKTVQGATVETGTAAGIVTVGDAMVTQADLNATNGVVHLVDRVLLPPKK